MKYEYIVLYNEEKETCDLYDKNRNIISNNTKFSTEDNITITIDLYESIVDEEKFFDSFALLLNNVSSFGTKVSIRVLVGIDISHSILNCDVIGNIMSQSQKIKNKENIELFYAPNGYSVPFLECELIENKFELAVQEIEEKNFSPLEKFIAAYKMCLNFFPTDSLGNGKYSYDKYSSIYMFPNVIPTCQSYTQIFEKLCKGLNLKYEYRTTEAGDSNHAVDIIILNDEKYNINGRYFVDITLSKTWVKYLNINNKIVDDELPICINAFGLGKKGIDIWATAYKNKVVWDDFKCYFKLSEEDIPKDVIKTAQETVNSAFIQNQSHK